MDIKQFVVEKKPLAFRAERFFLFDFFLLTVAYFLVNLFKRGGVALSPGYTALLVLFIICWLCASFAAGKFEIQGEVSFKDGVTCLIKSTLYMVYFISFAIVVSGASGFSRVQIYMACLVFFLLEFGTWLIYGTWIKEKDIDCREAAEEAVVEEKSKSSFSMSLFWMDGFLMCTAFLMVNWIKRGHIGLLPGYEKLFFILIGLWFAVSMATAKFRDTARQSIYYSAGQWMKAGMIMLALMCVAVFGFRLFYFSRFQALGPFVLLMGFEIVVLWMYGRWKQGKEISRDVESAEEVKRVLDQEDIATDIDVDTLRRQLMEPVKEKLKVRLGEKDAGLFEFVDDYLPLGDILCMEAAADNSRKLFSLTREQMPVRLLLNLRKINNIRRINQYFLEIYQTLLPGGYFICRAHTIVTHKAWIRSKFKDSRLAEAAIFIDFLINRVIPKLPVFKKVFFAVTKGRNRVISKAELMGRLSFCGFEIVAEKVIDRRLCVIARKVKTPSVNVSPTYGPLVTLNRVGFNREVIKTYKFRTMHPYSEYLQQYVFDNCGGTIDGDGFQNDFRITEWGVIFRKLWIDELPMIANWVKGELKLVGVRPLSLQKFNMYSKRVQELRIKVKPGLVPPFYADLPKNMEELEASEERYIHRYLKNPIFTDVTYFFKSMWNILIKRVRSK